MNEIYSIWDMEKNTIAGEYSMENIIEHAGELPRKRKFLSCYATYGSDADTKILHDNNGNLVKEFDILSLEITEDLMKTPFSNSNLGKSLEKEGNVKNIVTILNERNKNYELYYVRNDGYILRNPDGEAESICVGNNVDFIFYLVKKGACVVANSKTHPNYIKSIMEPLENEKDER